jgi:IPT/TIG domain/Lactonase, 7-bladed beta-propeller
MMPVSTGTMLTASPHQEPSYRRAPARGPALAAGLAALILAATALVAVAIPARAGATVLSGSLAQLGEPADCIGETQEEVAKCGTKVPFGLSFAYEVQVSPDGKNAYSVAVNGDLIEYSRNLASGALTVIGCYSSASSSEPCAKGSAEGNAKMEVSAIAGPAAIAISPDGANAYVVAQGTSDIVEFSRESETGLLTKIGCITQEASSAECVTNAKGLNTPYGVTISPNGQNVYVASLGSEAIAEFSRNTEESSPEKGMLTAIPSHECIGSATSGCPTTAIGLKEVIGVVVSPDEENVYAAAGAKGVDGDVAAFSREASTGALEQLPGREACISEKLVPECTEGHAVQGSEDLVISPDGKNVYANSYTTNAVIELERSESTGALTQLGAPNACVTTAITSETADCTLAKSISGPIGVAISPRGENLYVSSSGENAEAAFARNPATGVLTQLAEPFECLTSNSSGCGGTGGLAEFNERVGLEGARRVVVSPDGTNVYLAGQSAHAIVELRRYLKPAVTVVTPNHGPVTGAAPITIRGTGFIEGAEVYFNNKPAKSATVNSASSITATPPEGLAGGANVNVVGPAGESLDVRSDLYDAFNRPVVSGVSPSVGKFAGGTAVTITGSLFSPGATVDFGSKPAASVTFDSSSSLTASSPPGSGTADVTVKTGEGESVVTDNDHFDYVSGGPKELGGVDLAAYCSSIGDTGDGAGTVALVRGEIGGTGYAYENWACIETEGSETLIANAGATLSEEAICRSQYPGTTSYAYPEDPDSAYSWNCYEAAGGESEESKGGGGGGGKEGGGEESKKNSSSETPTAQISSTVGPVSPVVSGSSAVPPPVLTQTGNVAPVSGSVLVELPGTTRFVPLSTLEQIPFGAVIEATHGTVSVTTALPGGGTQTGEFFEGEFILRQGPNGLVVAELTGGDFAVSATSRSARPRASARTRPASVGRPGMPWRRVIPTRRQPPRAATWCANCGRTPTANSRPRATTPPARCRAPNG